MFGASRNAVRLPSGTAFAIVGIATYGGLSAAGVFLLCVSAVDGLSWLWSGFDKFMSNQTGGTEIMIGLGLVAVGVIINGLIKLAIDVANDIHTELSTLNEKTAVHTKLLASLANTATNDVPVSD